LDIFAPHYTIFCCLSVSEVMSTDLFSTDMYAIKLQV
jgi:hypothetical protein